MGNQLKVLKFGGGSMRCPKGLLRCARILMRGDSPRLAVLSATYDSTNLLETIFKFISNGELEKAKIKLEDFFSIHWDYAKELDLTAEVEPFFRTLEAEGEGLLQNPKKDQLLSLGERSSSYLFNKLLNKIYPDKNIHYLDARDYIMTDSIFGAANPNMIKINSELRQNLVPKLKNDSVIITQGFIGKDSNNQTTTLGREGSDYSAAIFAHGLDAECLEIWKDVSGFYRVDPKMVLNAHKIDQMSYDDASLLTESGAKILFPKTLNPMKEKGIPVFIGSSLNPDEEGTWIREKVKTLDSFLGISFVEDVHTFKLFSKNDVSNEVLNKGIREALLHNELKLLHFYSHEKEANLIVERNEKLISQFRLHIEEFSNYDIFDGYSLITLHGTRLDKYESKINEFSKTMIEGQKSIELLSFETNRIELLTKKKILSETVNSLYQVMYS